MKVVEKKTILYCFILQISFTNVGVLALINYYVYADVGVFTNIEFKNSG